jgi:hypothetical protein
VKRGEWEWGGGEWRVVGRGEVERGSGSGEGESGEGEREGKENSTG